MYNVSIQMINNNKLKLPKYHKTKLEKNLTAIEKENHETLLLCVSTLLKT